jgi:hypothetical protein
VGKGARGLLGGGIRGDRHGWGFWRKVGMESRSVCGEGFRRLFVYWAWHIY